MDIRDFLSVMRLLKAFYIDWPFDFSDKVQVSTWYAYLGGMEFEKLKKVVNFYISKNDMGPNNPGELLKAQIEHDLKQMINAGDLEGDE